MLTTYMYIINTKKLVDCYEIRKAIISIIILVKFKSYYLLDHVIVVDINWVLIQILFKKYHF